MVDSKATILIIEDEPGFRRIYKDFLESEGFRVLEASDGQKGLAMIRAEKPDLVLLDIVVPNLSGFEILQRVREDGQVGSTPIIIFSVLGEKETIKKGLELGANDFAVKGFYSPGEMLSKIHALLSRSATAKNAFGYLVGIQEGRFDAARLEQDLGLRKLFSCPHCNTHLALELTPDTSRLGGHWFTAHLVCPSCKQQI